MIEIVLTAFAAFISTNVDDLFIIMTLFTSTTLTRQHIYAGQYLGLSVLILLSIIGTLIGFVIPLAYIGLLGLVPIYLGIRKIIDHWRDKEDDDENEIDQNKVNGFLSALISVQTLNVAAIAIANGGDNIGIYIPLFSTFSVTELAITIFIFMILIYPLLKTSEYLTKHPLLAKTFKKYNPVIFPIVLIGLGIYIIYESKTYALLK